MAITLQPLPPYPSTRARASFTPSQSATLVQTISNALSQVLSLSDSQISTPATLTFISSYAKDVAQQSLLALVWGTEDPSTKLSQAERKVRHAVFLLAERLAPLGALDLQLLIDLSVAYARISPSRLRALFLAAFVQGRNSSALVEDVQNSAFPAFTGLLSSTTHGLYGLRKTAHIILSFLRPAPAAVTRIFARKKTFVRALAYAYHAGLASLAETYGGIRALSTATSQPESRELDEWERLFLETKAALLDAFHILVSTLLDDVASVAQAGPALAAQAEPAFDVIFALVDLPSGGDGGLAPTAFLNRPLLADYQHAYDFDRTLKDVLRRTEDARADVLEMSLREMAVSADGASGSASRAPGALKLILRSSGVPPGIDNLGRGPGSTAAKADSKGKGKDMGVGAGEARVPDEQLDVAVTQVLDLLPDQDAGYIRYLLSHNDYPYRGDAERLIGALLEGTAPSPAEVEAALAREGEMEGGAGGAAGAVPQDEFAFTRERRNVWDDEVMDLSRVKIGKKSDDAHTLLEDRRFIEQMKADILRRAEEISDSEDEDADAQDPANHDKERGRAIAFEEELDDDNAIRVQDGGSSDGEEGSDGEDSGGVGIPRNPETILELAYIQDPKAFERDGQTRRSKVRADLKAQTGWGDEQIEGWKIMLERDPKRKEKMLAKHEFTGNKPTLNAPVAEGSQAASRGGASHGPRGRGRGRGRGGRGGGGGGGGGDETARDRAWKDKNKARRGNHDRKRGHDKKMAKVGGPS
uniref:Cytochrome P450 monooxygenase CYP52X1 n=1 Tax=Ganoderma boninense TaxID=34458 RepID=A0A5K1JUD3_9APHY|nr:Cytochrome P450 monooxygenase CYP52X1 [Ganoderma boninense]